MIFRLLCAERGFRAQDPSHVKSAPFENGQGGGDP
jgi:hypothetical protein